jgi:ATP-dependent DNA ligase
MIIEGAGHISHRIALMEQAAGCQLVIDGEFQVGGTLKTTKAWCEANWKEGGEAGTLFAFDCITQAEWKAGGSDVPLHKRKARLVALWHAAQALATDEWDWRPRSRGSDTDTQPVRVLPHVQVFIRQDVIELAHRVWGFGGEGLMIKDIVGGYQRNRSRDWLKVKQGQAWQQRSA